MFKNRFAATAAIFLCGLCASAQDIRISLTGAPTVTEAALLESGTIPDFKEAIIEGNTRSFRTGTLWIEARGNRSKAESKPVLLPVVRIYTEASNPAPPVVYLAGGPGGSAINAVNADYMRPIFLDLLETRDVVLMDQRGTGRSRPRTLWVSREPLPLDIFTSYEAAREEIRERHKAAKASFEERGLDLSAYTNVEAAADLELLRRALGVEKIGLLGFSYGTHLALVTIRRYGDNLDRVAMAGVEGPDDTYKPPSIYDAQLDRISDVLRQDPAWAELLPDMKAAWKRILERAAEEPFEYEIERRGETVTLPVGPWGLKWIIRRDLGDTNDLPRFPNIFYDLLNGDGSALQFYVNRRYNEWGRGLSGMSLMTDISAGASPERIARVEEEAKTALFGNSMNFEYFDARDIWGYPDIGAEHREPIQSNVRALFISGTLDCQTPPKQTEAVRSGFPNSAHVIVKNAGHESTLPHPEVRALIKAFFEGEEIGDRTVEYPLNFDPPRNR